jgi:hypothetical protein
MRETVKALYELEEAIVEALQSTPTKFIGERSSVGNKAGGVGNRIRAVLAKS